MKVYFEELATHKRAGGVETVCRELVEHMETLGVEITRSSSQAWSFSDSLPDCVHVQGLWSPLLGKRLFRWTQLNVPCVVSPHGMLEKSALTHKSLRKKAAWWLYQKALLNRASALHATSSSEADQFRTLGLTADIVTIPWGVRVPPTPSSLSEHSADNRFDRALRTALFVGRLCPVKGLPMLLEAWHRVRPKDWSLKIVGPNEAGYRATIDAIIRSANLGGTVQVVGELRGEAMQATYAQADLFVLPSHSENFGMVVGEALAAHLPVLTTRGTPWQQVAATGCGWWVPPTVDGITEALQEATSASSQTLRAMGRRGFELVTTEFQWSTAARRFQELYNHLVNRQVPSFCLKQNQRS